MHLRSSISGCLLLICTTNFAVSNEICEQSLAMNPCDARDRYLVRAHVAAWSVTMYVTTKLSKIWIEVLEKGDENAVQRSVKKEQQMRIYSTDKCCRRVLWGCSCTVL